MSDAINNVLNLFIDAPAPRKCGHTPKHLQTKLPQVARPQTQRRRLRHPQMKHHEDPRRENHTSSHRCLKRRRTFAPSERQQGAVLTAVSSLILFIFHRAIRTAFPSDEANHQKEAADEKGCPSSHEARNREAVNDEKQSDHSTATTELNEKRHWPAGTVFVERHRAGSPWRLTINWSGAPRSGTSARMPRMKGKRPLFPPMLRKRRDFSRRASACPLARNWIHSGIVKRAFEIPILMLASWDSYWVILVTSAVLPFYRVHIGVAAFKRVRARRKNVVMNLAEENQ